MKDVAAIARDARRVHTVAQQDAHDHKLFGSYLSRHELDVFDRDIAALEAGDEALTTRLQAKIAAGVHVAEIRASVLHIAQLIREDARVRFASDEAQKSAFGVGQAVSAASTPQVDELARALVLAASKHPEQAKQVGLEPASVHDMERMIVALEGADAAHNDMARSPSTKTATDSLACKVSHEAAHMRLVARRAFRDDDKAKLARYETTLPRQEPTKRAK
jgi:hypothetical protein